ncbi:hypothetical protein FN976_11140 [Caenimonas sedimenti]|uniref:Type IV secretion system protein VirB3 n=1 Tax=Caenimonas sedimenti TaxID=2596921 RepID=A0A562ZSG0_9BURK|nr:VirB3 family type IV secretion system protein [Caenimonas sedimenti]TWO71463.1 hypothetical protein FN976_11140 [Caenimonas sedimenti]
MASRFSHFHTSLHRPKLIMGIEKGMFAGLMMLVTMGMGLRAYWFIPLAFLLFLVGRWLSKRDDQYVANLAAYLREEHIYDATPRPKDDVWMRPKGWGRGLPR